MHQRRRRLALGRVVHAHAHGAGQRLARGGAGREGLGGSAGECVSVSVCGIGLGLPDFVLELRQAADERLELFAGDVCLALALLLGVAERRVRPKHHCCGHRRRNVLGHLFGFGEELLENVCELDDVRQHLAELAVRPLHQRHQRLLLDNIHLTHTSTSTILIALLALARTRRALLISVFGNGLSDHIGQRRVGGGGGSGRHAMRGRPARGRRIDTGDGGRVVGGGLGDVE
mmetsp:Transcript_35851/g.89320  ORF Transcript_35851/g.89320 Transcript_35851/m.89320 type:complete len:231 (+) Transcript_35851:1712-2404(+)